MEQGWVEKLIAQKRSPEQETLSEQAEHNVEASIDAFVTKSYHESFKKGDKTMKYIYVVAERNPYKALVREAETGHITCAFTAEKILELMGDTAILNAVYEILIRDSQMNPGDILAPERP